MQVVLTAGQARALAAGHPWIPAGGLPEGRRGLRAGQAVTLTDGRGRVLGTALAAPGEKAILRLWSREAEPVSRETVTGRAAAAWGRRKTLRARGDTDAYRLIHGEGDGLPGLFADAWGPYVTVELQTAAWDPWLAAALDALERLARPKGILHRRRIPGADGAVPEGEARLARGEAPPSELEVKESGLRYRVRLADLKPGLFPDERENRAWLAPQCRGKTVLNAFSFTGAFSVAGAAAGASAVTSLDLSAPALARLEANLRLNGIDPVPHPRVKGEALETMGRWAKEGKRFDVVILDPPAFATHKGGRWQAGRDYPDLAEAACRLLAPGGLLAAALTLHEVSPERFERMLAEGAARAGRSISSVVRRGMPEDFPALPGFPEGSTLKFAAMALR